ncbi:uncharacterized protein Dwil_GK16980 [Drosophila willistoni]|uniref:Uncharacterized protein n=3 Tax=Drosophila willistoni TaxID=7260 RepID=A0A0Q9WP28_DROWI|nr:uncharacterized protein Dwil_GK16980 [Drosophila willistoni]
MGYVLGIFLVLIWYYWHPHRSSQDLNGKWLLLILLALFVLILCYSRATRCVIALSLPTLGSYKGRALLIAFAFFIAVTGPVLNIIRNIGILAHCISCGQTLLKQALIPMHEIMGDPIYAVEQSINTTMSEVRKIMEHLERVLNHLGGPIATIHSSYRTCAEWLRLQQTSFENQMGHPYDRCIGAGSISIQECRAKFGHENKACMAKERFEWFCGNLKELSSFFDGNLQLQQNLLEDIFQHLYVSFAKIHSIFEVTITFDHNRQSGITSKIGNSSDVILEHEISRHLESQMQSFLIVFLWLDTVVFILILTVLLKSIYFRMHYLGSNDYANVYLMQDFYSYDKQLQRLMGVSALPLRAYEQTRYVKITSLRLLPIEISIMTRSVLFLIITGFQLFTICFVDYSLYWMMALMSYHSHRTAELQPRPYTKIVIKGGGMIGNIIRGVVHGFEPLVKNLFIDTVKCLPIPGPPKYLNYWEIFVLCIMAWFLLIWEPYSLRLRHRVMTCFYPEHGSTRAQYLCRRILKDRETFIKGARRKARSLHTYANQDEEFICIMWYHTLKNWCCGRLTGNYLGKVCLICNKALTISDNVSCRTPNCNGIYCQVCFAESNCSCILCNPPSVYGDYSDISEIEDSSDDSESNSYRPDGIKCNDRHKSA